MGEERIIDDDLDKNKKYKIRKNADGEDELYFDGSEEAVEITYGDDETPQFYGDDGETAVLTPGQLAALEDERRRDDEQKRQFVDGCLKKAEELYSKGDLSGALGNLDSAEQTDGKRGEIYALKIKVLTRGFSDFSAAEECAALSEDIRNYCTKEQKAMLSSLCAPLERHIESLEEKSAALHVEVEEKKSERRAVFSKERGKALKIFTFTAVPFVACLVLAVSFGSVMFAKENGVNLILTIVFAALAAVLFAVTLFTAHRMWSAMQKYSLNEKNSSTRIGREYEELCATVKKLKTLLASFKEEV